MVLILDGNLEMAFSLDQQQSHKIKNTGFTSNVRNVLLVSWILKNIYLISAETNSDKQLMATPMFEINPGVIIQNTMMVEGGGGWPLGKK